MLTRQKAKIITALTLLILVSTSYADTGDQKLRQALAGLADAAAKLKVSSEVFKGGKVFEAYCLACHGPDIPLPSIAQSSLMREPNAEMVNFILFSRSGAKHPSWHMALSPIDVSNLANFLQVAFKTNPTELVTPEEVVAVIERRYKSDKIECNAPK